jgi:hypothetical protein
MHWCPAPLQDPAFYAAHNSHELDNHLCLDACMSQFYPTGHTNQSFRSSNRPSYRQGSSYC